MIESRYQKAACEDIMGCFMFVGRGAGMPAGSGVLLLAVAAAGGHKKTGGK